MGSEPSALALLGTRLAPWLTEPLQRIEAARRAGRLAHGWLIKGPAGVGKINLALVFAHRLLEETDPDAPVPPLEAAQAGTAVRDRHAPADHAPDLHWLFPEDDKKTISVEQVRAVTDALGLKGFRGGGKVVVVEPAEAMTGAAANALLKTLEEPTARTYLLLLAHRPDRLLPTIRSRCQTLIVGRPPAAEVAAWLGVDEHEASEILLLARGSPFRALELMSAETIQFIKSLEQKLHLVSTLKIDPQAVADEWHKTNPELALEWLIGRIERTIRVRLAARDSKAVTDRGADPLHNAWQALPVGALFGLLRAAESLLDRLGGGINSELALRVLLLGFQPDRG